MPDRTWLRAVADLRTRRVPGVLVTVADVRGHAPRAAGAKMVVSPDAVHGSVGGGNVEAVAIETARAMLDGSAPAATRLDREALSDKAPYRHGVQCCGGELTLLYEPLPVLPSVAVFGIGHVGWELARILARHELELHLVDTRPEQLEQTRLAVLDDAVAEVHVHRPPVMPEIVLGEIPAGSHVLVMTHDHAEDLALCDALLRHGQMASIGLIGSSAKWVRFRSHLIDAGLPAEAVDSIQTPIGLPELTGKEPATIAVGVAADLLRRFTAPTSGASDRDAVEGRPAHQDAAP